ncbi:hypothetical protein ACHAXR_009078 [Thalassiosira sp. AJA248-18]
MASRRSRSKSQKRRGGGEGADDDDKTKLPVCSSPTEEEEEEEDMVAIDNNNGPDDDPANMNMLQDDVVVDDDGSNTNNNKSKSKLKWINAQSALTNNLLPLLSRPEDDLLTMLLLREHHQQAAAGEQQSQEANNNNKRQLLLTASQQLFRYIEHLADMEERLKKMQSQKKLNQSMEQGHDDVDDDEEEDGGNNDDDEPCGLSGIPSLYTGHHDDEAAEEEAAAAAAVAVDAETIWGQVDLQNGGLLPRLKKMIKKLGRRCDDNDDVVGDDGGEEEEGGKKREKKKKKKRYGDDDMVRILDTGAMMLDDDDDNNDEGGSSDEDAGMSQQESMTSDNDSYGNGDSDEDSEACRIRKRMEKAMADMSDDDDDDDEDDELNEEAGDKSKEQHLKELSSAAALENNEEDDTSIIDPTREDMRDGFFDLHEMEAFADEEEEMLPDDAYGEEEMVAGNDDDEDGEGELKGKKKKGGKKVLPHVRDRVGNGDDSDSENEEEEDSDDDDELAKRFQPTSVRRKKYRADDEVEALYQLYDGQENDNADFDDSDNEEEGTGGVVDASAMSAADFFGKPNKKLIKSYKAKKKKGDKNNKKGGSSSSAKSKEAMIGNDNDDDADSWDNHNFEEDGMDWKANGGMEDDEDEDGSEEGNKAGEDDQNSEDDDEEEEVEMNDNEDNKSDKKLSAHAIQSKKLQEQTLQLEQDMMAEKPWRMMGEAKGTDRTTDSLLDSTPEFEVAFKPPPILTAEHTTDIETMIKQRVIDEDWDDVVPRELPDIGLNKRGGGDAPDVSQEKSKLGLGELYEREYLKKSVGYDRTSHEKTTEEDAAKEEMKELFANLCSQLDALSNYHFAPRPVADEANVQNREDVPAIAMEEVLPLHVSQSRGKAPEEVYGAGKGRKSVLKGESELDQAERKRLRSAKKSARRKERKQKHADEKLISKLQPGLGLNNPYEKRKLREELQEARASGKVVVASENKGLYNDEAAAEKEYQTSTKFFAKMQENVDSMVHGDGDDGRAKKKRKGLESGHGSSVYRL